MLAWALGHTRSVLVLAVAIFAAGVSLVPFISTSFFPRVDTGEVSVSYRLAEGQRIEETERVARQILAIMPRIVPQDWILFTYTKTGENEMGYAVAPPASSRDPTSARCASNWSTSISATCPSKPWARRAAPGSGKDRRTGQGSSQHRKRARQRHHGRTQTDFHRGARLRHGPQ